MIWLVICAWRLRLYASVSTLRRSRALSDALFIAFMRAASSDASASCAHPQMNLEYKSAVLITDLGTLQCDSTVIACTVGC